MIGIARLTLAFILTLASIIQGEGGVELELLGPVIGRVGIQRAAIGLDFGGWHGFAPPSERAVEMAWEAYRAGSTPDGDLFALSDADCKKLGVTWGTRYGNDVWGITTMRRWP